MIRLRDRLIKGTTLNLIAVVFNQGSTLVANGLEVVTDLADIKVRLIANPAYFKLRYRGIAELADIMTRES